MSSEKLQRSGSTTRIEVAITNIRVDAATAEVLRALERVGLRAILLKGPALADWESKEYARAYVDCDLWLAPSAMRAAERTLGELGFAPDQQSRGLPRWWREHASNWTRGADGVAVDLHGSLQGVGVRGERAWELLQGEAEAIEVAGHRAYRLSTPARALYVALHAAHHGTLSARSLARLEAAVAAAGEDVWRAAGALAVELDAVDAFGSGLRLSSRGAELAERLALPATASVSVALHASTPPPVALGFEQLRRAGWMAPWVLVRKLIPPRGFIRHWWPPAARSRRMLALGYAYRPVWLLRNAPRGWRAWRAASAQVRAERDQARSASRRS